MSQLEYLAPWRVAMERGELGNGPFSPLTIEDYLARITLFLAQYGSLTFPNAKAALRAIPLKNHGKHAKLFKAIVCFAKFLHAEGVDIDKRLVVRNRQIPEELAALKIKPTNLKDLVIVSEQDVINLLTACRDPYETLILTLLSATGLRASEAAGITLNDCNFERKYIQIRPEIAKFRKARKVPLHRPLRKAIDRYIRWRDERITNDEPLLLVTKGKSSNRYKLNKALEDIGERISLDVYPHALRHYFVTYNLAKGVPPEYVRMMCGHADLQTTLDYAQTQEADVLDYMQKMDD